MDISIKKQIKKELLYKFDNLRNASEVLSIRYYRLINILGGRTQASSSEKEKLQGFLVKGRSGRLQ